MNSAARIAWVVTIAAAGCTCAPEHGLEFVLTSTDPGHAPDESMAAVLRARLEGRWAEVVVEGPTIRVRVGSDRPPVLTRARLTRRGHLAMRLAADAQSHALASPELPGVARALESYMGPDGAVVSAAYFTASDREVLRRWADGARPPGTDVVVSTFAPRSGPSGYRTWLVESDVVVSERDVQTAAVARKEGVDQLELRLRLKPDAAARFAALTRTNVGRRLVIAWDDDVLVAPVIQSEIGGGALTISVGPQQTPQDELRTLQEMTTILRAGALAVPLEVARESVF